MPPITVQQPAEYSILERTEVPNGGTPAYEDAGAPFILAGKSTSPADFDVYYRRLLDSAAIKALLIGLPVALPPVVTPDPDDTSASIVRLPYSGGRATFVSGAFAKSQTGTLVTHLGGEHFRVKVDPTYRAQFDEGTPIQASFEAEAVMELATHRKISWSPVLLSSTGTKVPAPVQGPLVIAQPAPLSFSEGVPTAFTVDLKPFFTVTANPATYEVLNSDGTALTNFVLGSITNGVASLTSQATGSGLKNALYRVTDANAKTASVSSSWDVVANPLPVILSGITPISIAIAQTGNFPLAAASVFSDSETLAYALKNANGTAPPAGYSWDGVNIAYPVEGGAVARSFILRATETGALARSVDTEAFTFDRPASPVVIIDPVQAVTWPENATTVQRVNVRTALGTDAAEDITIPAALTGKVTKNAVGSGVFDLTGVFANNEILSGIATYSGTIAGSPVQGTPTFKSIHNPPVDGTPAIITANADSSVRVPVIQFSDDPAINRIVAGSAVAEGGQISITADLKEVILTISTNATTDVTYSYTLEAGAGGPQTIVTGKIIGFQGVVGPRSSGTATISTQSTDGTAFPVLDLSPFWTQANYPIDPASYQFFDSLGNALGKSRTVDGVGTFTISPSAASVSFTAISGWVGTNTLLLAPSDINGNVGDIKPWVETQLAAPTAPPPPDPNAVFPNTLDGKIIQQVGIETHRWHSGSSLYFKNKRMMLPLDLASAGSQQPWSTDLKSSYQKILDGESDPTKGWIYLAPGETTYFYFPRWWQSGGHPEIRTGNWAFSWDVMTGGTATITAAGWSANGGSSGLTGGQSSLINGGAAFNFDRLRYTRNLTSSDTFQAVYSISNSGVAGTWVRYWFGGEVAAEATWEASPFDSVALTDLGEQKIIRVMDAQFITCRVAKADDLIRGGDYAISGDGGTWGGPLAANNTLRRAGTDIRLWAKGCVAASAALWCCIPMTMGMNATDGLADGFYTPSATANTTISVGGVATVNPPHDAYRNVIASNLASILAEARAQVRLQAQRWVQDLIDAAYPDHFIWYCELSNEIWNGSFTFQNRYAFALQWVLRNRTDGKPTLPSLTNGGGAAGYIANLFATEIARVISEMKPNQQFRFGVGAQTSAGTSFASGVADGWELYEKEFPASSLPISRIGIATTNYLSGAFKWDNKSAGAGNPWGAQTETEFVNAFVASHAAGGEAGLFAEIRDWYVNPASRSSSVFGQLGRITAHADVCAARGMEYWGNYEGSFHEDTGGLLGSTFGINALNALRNNFIRGAFGEEVVRKFITEFQLLYPAKIVSNYYKYTRTGNWGSQGAWYEKSISEFGIAPTTGAAKAFYDFSRQGAGGPPPVQPPATLPVYNEDFETNNTTALLASLGHVFGGNGTWSVVTDGGQKSVYNSNELGLWTYDFRQAAQTNSTLVWETEFVCDNTKIYSVIQFEDVSTGKKVYVQLVDQGGGTRGLGVGFVGNSNDPPFAATTTGINVFDGLPHKLRFTYFAAASGGLIEVKDVTSGTVYGTFSGNTNPNALASVNLTRVHRRGKTKFRSEKDATP